MTVPHSSLEAAFHGAMQQLFAAEDQIAAAALSLTRSDMRSRLHWVEAPDFGAQMSMRTNEVVFYARAVACSLVPLPNPYLP